MGVEKGEGGRERTGEQGSALNGGQTKQRIKNAIATDKNKNKKINR